MFLYAKRFSICSFQMHDATFKSIILCENPIKDLIATLVSLETVEVRLLSRYIHTRSLEIREMKRLATKGSFDTTGNDYCFSARIDVKHIGGYYRVFFAYPCMIKILNIWKLLSILLRRNSDVLLGRNSATWHNFEILPI